MNGALEAGGIVDHHTGLKGTRDLGLREMRHCRTLISRPTLPRAAWTSTPEAFAPVVKIVRLVFFPKIFLKTIMSHSLKGSQLARGNDGILVSKRRTYCARCFAATLCVIFPLQMTCESFTLLSMATQRVRVLPFLWHALGRGLVFLPSTILISTHFLWGTA